ncbi:hypothetical protein BDP55DRAFT_344020 [Colletotrichum godetiae]|uniref:Uncharacterized protein n=1 Tax=Colletotrichum godetiae TaxID=1209918 RepID=A0AAJ0AY60_9PEZI|nr:uncharacterized protein BDP55DRAFT_344020 [Colletotrichum godetiae]KAK1690274.1 hypothetical protein BDP55DRAFT_344020 [Colletotrichum godetiae]
MSTSSKDVFSKRFQCWVTGAPHKRDTSSSTQRAFNPQFPSYFMKTSISCTLASRPGADDSQCRSAAVHHRCCPHNVKPFRSEPCRPVSGSMEGKRASASISSGRAISGQSHRQAVTSIRPTCTIRTTDHHPWVFVLELQVAAKRAAHTARPFRQAVASASRTHFAGLAVEHQPLMVVHQLYSSLDTSHTMSRRPVISTGVAKVFRVTEVLLDASNMQRAISPIRG